MARLLAFSAFGAGVQHASYEGDAQGVLGPYGGAVAGPGAEAPTQRQPHVDHGEDAEPQDEGPGVGLGDGPVDDHADQDRYQRLAQLMPGAEERAEGDVPSLPSDRFPQDVPPRRS